MHSNKDYILLSLYYHVYYDVSLTFFLANPVYDNCPAFISHSIEQVQRRAALACTGAYRDTSCVLAKRVGMAYPSKRRKYYKICQMYKLQNKISPACMVGHLPLNRADHAYALRNNNDIRVPLSRTISFRNSFIPSSIRLWNAVDPSIQNCSSLSSFKRHLRNSKFSTVFLRKRQRSSLSRTHKNGPQRTKSTQTQIQLHASCIM